MSCLLICKNINSAYLKGKNMLQNVFNTNLYFICFISILVLIDIVLKFKNKLPLFKKEILSSKQTKGIK
jgi:hypothetical protein